MITLIIGLVIVGVALYFIENYLPMSPPIKMLIRIVVILLICVWLLRFFGITDATFR